MVLNLAELGKYGVGDYLMEMRYVFWKATVSSEVS